MNETTLHLLVDQFLLHALTRHLKEALFILQTANPYLADFFLTQGAKMTLKCCY